MARSTASRPRKKSGLRCVFCHAPRADCILLAARNGKAPAICDECLMVAVALFVEETGGRFGDPTAALAQIISAYAHEHEWDIKELISITGELRAKSAKGSASFKVYAERKKALQALSRSPRRVKKST